jgi:hypothetical protein
MSTRTILSLVLSYHSLSGAHQGIKHVPYMSRVPW